MAEPEEDGPARLMVDGAARRAIRAANSVSMDFDMDFDRSACARAAGGAPHAVLQFDVDVLAFVC